MRNSEWGISHRSSYGPTSGECGMVSWEWGGIPEVTRLRSYELRRGREDGKKNSNFAVLLGEGMEDKWRTTDEGPQIGGWGSGSLLKIED